jgi:hypothetical protein
VSVSRWCYLGGCEYICCGNALVAAIFKRCANRAATMPRRRDALEAAIVSPSFFLPSTFRCMVGVYIDIPERLMTSTTPFMEFSVAHTSSVAPKHAAGRTNNLCHASSRTALLVV